MCYTLLSFVKYVLFYVKISKNTPFDFDLQSLQNADQRVYEPIQYIKMLALTLAIY